MQGPLKTSIRNLTQQALIYGVTNRIFLRPESENLYDFDPFTKWENNAALGNLLADVKRGRVAITYIYDSEFTAAVPGNFAHIPKKIADALRLQIEKKPEPVEAVVKEAPKKPIRPEGTLPPGELPPDPVMEEPKITKDMRIEQKLAISAAEAAGIKKEAEMAKTSEKVEEMLQEQNLQAQPEQASEKSTIEEPVTEIKTAKRGGRKAKKEVVSL